MASSPFTIAGQVISSSDELVALLDHRGRNHITDNPAQLAPAEGLIEDQRDPAKAKALATAAAALIEHSDDPGVLQLCAHIGGHGLETFYHALVMRLMVGAPIPDVAGMSEPTLVEELATTLSVKQLGDYPYLHRLAIDCLKARGLYRSALLVMAASDPENECADLLIDMLTDQPVDDRTATAFALAIYRMAREDSDRLLDIAPSLVDHPEALHALCIKRAEQGSTAAHKFDGVPEQETWWARHGNTFTGAIGFTDAAAVQRKLDPLLVNAVENLESIAYALGLPLAASKHTPWLPARRAATTTGMQAVFDQVAAAVAPLTDHSHLLIRRQALAVLAVAPSVETTDALVRMCGSDQPELRAQALAFFADHDPQAAAPLLQQSLTDEHAVVRLYAWTGLPGNRRWPELEDQALAEPDPAVARAALRYLGASGLTSAIERLLDIVVDDEQPSLRLEGAVEGLIASGPRNNMLVIDRLATASPAAQWRLCTILDAHDALDSTYVQALVTDATPTRTRIEAAAWLAARELADHQSGAGYEILTAALTTGSSLDRVFAATSCVGIGENMAMLHILPLWFGPESVRNTVRASLRGADRFADRPLAAWVKRACEKPPTGAGVIELLRVRGVTGHAEHVRQAATAEASDDLTRAALVSLFAEQADDATALLNAELDQRHGVAQLQWATGFLELEPPLPTLFTDALLERPEALLVNLGLDLVAHHNRPETQSAFQRVLASETARIRNQAPARPDMGTGAIASSEAFLDRVKQDSDGLRQQLSDDRPLLAMFESLEHQLWTDPSGMVIANVMRLAGELGLVELAAAVDDITGADFPLHLRLCAVSTLMALAPWRLDDRDLSPDPDGLLDRVRRSSVGTKVV